MTRPIRSATLLREIAEIALRHHQAEFPHVTVDDVLDAWAINEESAYVGDRNAHMRARFGSEWVVRKSDHAPYYWAGVGEWLTEELDAIAGERWESIKTRKAPSPAS